MDDTPLTVSPGTTVTVELVSESGEHEPMSFQIVPDKLADLKNGFLGEGTPLAKTLAGCTTGELVPYRMGDICAVQVVSVTPAQTAPDPGVVARREETLRKAVKQSEITNAINLATTFSSKWGDYDPTTLSEELDKE